MRIVTMNWLLLVHFVEIAVAIELASGQDSWTCTTNTAAVVTKSHHKELEDKVHLLEVQVQQLQKLVGQQNVPPYSTIEGFPKDCLEIYRNGTRSDGLYSISPDGRCPFLVYCDMRHGGWTVIQKRIDDRINFYRSWDDYVTGFGDLDGSHWLGLEKIHRLTREGSQIYFDTENYDGTKEYAHYKVFTVHEAATAYKMNVDAFNYNGSLPELLSYHNSMKFSTFDRDNDEYPKSCCLDIYDGSGWWYKECYRLGNFNGVYGKKTRGGISYHDNSKDVFIKNVMIKIKQMNGVC